MTVEPDVLLRGVLIGIGGAALMDVWSLALRRGLGIPTLDYALLGRWIGNSQGVASFTSGSPRRGRSRVNDPLVGSLIT